MTITQMARFSMQKQQYEKKNAMVNLPNGSTPPPGYVNPHCPPGLDITGRTDWQKMIPVSDEATQKMKDFALSEMINNYGMTGTGSEYTDAIRAYHQTVPVNDRASAIWTLEQIHRTEVYRLADIVRARNPGWQPGQAFDTSILADEVQKQSGVDIRV